MNDREIAFIDTNILAYAFDETDKKRRQSCATIVRNGFQGEAEYYISNQVLSELFVVLTNYVGKPLSKERASVIVSSFADSTRWRKTNYTYVTVKRAMQDLRGINTSFWDMLIAETAKEAGVRTVYTENEKDFRKIPWIQVKNPITAS